jgi:long-chain fatty acid transport protein
MADMTRSGIRAAMVAVAGSLGTVGGAYAAGFGLRTGSADWVANAYAGNTAKGYDASTAWTNPAGMVRLNWNEIDASINGLFPSAEFSGANLGAGGVPIRGNGAPGDAIQDVATAGTFGVWSYSRDLKFGLAINAPFGLRVAYPNDWVGRYQSLFSSITDIEVLLSAAYRIDDHFSVGGGPVIDYFHARLTQAINIDPTGRTSALFGDPVADLRGDDIAAGYVLSGMYQLNSGTRFGLTYRSRIQHDIQGGQRIYVPPPLAQASPITNAGLLRLSSSADTQVTLPDSITFGAYHQITPRLAVMADVQWTHWSLVNNLTIVPTTPGVPATVTQLNLRNSWFGSVGASYKVTDKLMLQAGVAYDQTPIRNAANRTTRLPDYDRWELGVGATYAVLSNVNLQVGYVHEFAGNVSIRSAASPTSGVIVGTYNDSADVVSLGATIKF